MPNNPKKRIAGIISFNHESGTKLEIFGNFTPDKQRYDLILGHVEDKGLITLYQCINVAKRFNQIFTNTFRSIFLFTGINCYNINDLKFKHARISALHFDEWYNESTAFTIKEENNYKDITVEYKTPTFPTYEINNELKISFSFFPSGVQHSIVQKEVLIKQLSYINFSYKQKKYFKDITNDLHNFIDLLTLLTNTNSHLLEITLVVPTQELPYNKDVSLYVQSNKGRENKKTIIPDDMLFPYYILKERFEEIIIKWYNEQNKRATSSLPLFNEIYSLNLTTVDKFLSLTKSLEAFHRDYINSQNIYFVDRISELFERSRKIINPILKIKSKPKFSRKIKNYRNDFTHSNPRIRDTKTYVEMHYLKEIMKMIIYCEYFKDFGITENIIKQRFLSTRKFDHLGKKIKC